MLFKVKINRDTESPLNIQANWNRIKLSTNKVKYFVLQAIWFECVAKYIYLEVRFWEGENEQLKSQLNLVTFSLRKRVNFVYLFVCLM